MALKIIIIILFIICLLSAIWIINRSDNFRENKEVCEGYYAGIYNGSACNNIMFTERSNGLKVINPFPNEP